MREAVKALTLVVGGMVLGAILGWREAPRRAGESHPCMGSCTRRRIPNAQ
jgi:hypothetical protein